MTKYAHLLTKHEANEILEFEIIYYLPEGAIKTKNTDQAHNFGYDNDKYIGLRLY